MDTPPVGAHAPLEPLHDRVVIWLREEAETVTKSGIVIPDLAKEKPQYGVVVAVGPGEFNPYTGQRIPPSVAVGDMAWFPRYAGTETKIDGIPYVILPDRDILAVQRGAGKALLSEAFEKAQAGETPVDTQAIDAANPPADPESRAAVADVAHP